ncbi:MAG: helix-turn-helix transcriptional regulator [Lachnospiraceae bacterium]|nr:helix-turn-helix transcriptional regulator [Lachnospiraceae bacterium]
MADILANANYLDFYTINADYIGSRQVRNEQETVDFHNASTMRIWYNEQSDNYRQHWHTAVEIIMPVENYYDAKINDTFFHIMPGEVLVIPPGEIHELKAPETGKRFIFLFDITLITKLKGFSSIQSLLAQPLYITPQTYPQIYDDVYQILVQMRNEYFNKNEFAELVIYSQLLNFFVKFGYNRINTENLFPNVRLYKQKEYVQKFNNLMDYIDEHYMEDLNLEDIAESIGFSKFHFSRLFKQYTNFTFCDYLCYRRIKVAEELLAKPDLSITEIALQAGFPSISTFNRLFKQHKNCTPSEYRAKNRTRHNLT